MGTAIRLPLWAGALLSLSACATTATLPDLVVGRLEAAQAETTAGSDFSLATSIRNSGGAATTAPAAMDVRLHKSAGEPPITDLTGWRQADEARLQPGEASDDVATVRTPSLTPGAYSICASVDPDGAIAEADETNNETCIPFTVLAGAPRRADLVIEKITPIGAVEASLKVKVKIRNAGSEAAGPFRIMAFRRSPRQPLLLIECPLTEGQLASGSPASCDDLTQKSPLAAGASAELTGYFAYVIAGGASFVRTPVGPGNPNPPVSRTVDFMVDGCFPPEDGSPVYCAVDEIDELNNFKGATLKSR